MIYAYHLKDIAIIQNQIAGKVEFDVNLAAAIDNYDMLRNDKKPLKSLFSVTKLDKIMLLNEIRVATLLDSRQSEALTQRTSSSCRN